METRSANHRRSCCSAAPATSGWRSSRASRRRRRARVVLAVPAPGAREEPHERDLERPWLCSMSCVRRRPTAPPTSVRRRASSPTYGDLDVVIVAFGVLGDRPSSTPTRRARPTAVTVNYTGAVSARSPSPPSCGARATATSWCCRAWPASGCVRSNFVYGSSKAGLDGFAQGLGDALAGSGASVLVVRPGFVHSAMTTGMQARAVRHHPRRRGRA